MLILRLREVNLGHVAEVGGKNASLGELLAHLVPLGVRVPDGFAVTAEAFRLHLAQQGAGDEIYRALDDLDVRDVTALATLGERIRQRVTSLPLPAELVRQITAAYAAMGRGEVAVRSSATAEDLPGASFAGQHESYLAISGEAALLDAVRRCMASLFTDRAIVYRVEHGFAHRDVALSVGVQRMVRSDLASAGVIFTLDPESGFRDVVVITGAWGLGESVVQGRVNPDELWVHKPTLATGHRPIVRRTPGDKQVQLVYARGGTSATREERVPLERRRRLVLGDDEILQLARWAVAIEAHYKTPMDLEWAKDGQTGELFIVQARPETVHSRQDRAQLELFRLRGKGELLLAGRSVGTRIGAGPVRLVQSAADLAKVQPGEVLVAEMTDPAWEPVMRRAAAVVTDQGGRTCHAAIVSRELGLPCVVGTGDATRRLHDGQEITVSCAEGDEGRIYAGRLPFTHEKVDPRALASPRVPVMLNVGNPEAAFSLAQLPSAGVGLARLEFIVSSWIGVHPMALLHPERVTDPRVRAEVLARAAEHASPPAFFVERLATGIASIAAAFYPRPVIVRFSDFKTNEYAGLLGGADFEPVEANPMIGFRGASRYYDPRYREAFGLECVALQRVRRDMGLTNVKAMIPFCRTVGEGQRVLMELERHGLERGRDGFEVWVMCEIPSNVICANEFAELFDGFSIGSNDLTQLTLGVDRDSQLLAHLFDERDPAVLRLIESVIRVAHAHGRKVGLCGQAPSDHPELAVTLAGLGIDSLSVTADALPRVIANLAASPASR